MTVSYHWKCGVEKHECSVCLDSICNIPIDGKEPPHSWKHKDVITLTPKCNHLMHQDCVRNWHRHCLKLANRDVHFKYAPTCPVCKTAITEGDPANKKVVGVLWDCEKAETQDPTPSVMETPANETTLTLADGMELMDEAVKSHNFPAMWQLKSRYRFTLSPAQLKKVLGDALPELFNLNVSSPVDHKTRLALDLMTYDDASCRVVSDFFLEVLKIKGNRNRGVVKRLIDSKILSENVLKQAFNFHVAKGNFDQAKAMKEQYGFSLNGSELQEQLLKAYQAKTGIPDLESILSLHDKHNTACKEILSEILKTVAEQPKEYSAEIHDQYSDGFFVNYMNFINTLLYHGVKNQSAVNAAMTNAVSTLCNIGLDWASQLRNNHRATMDPEKLNVAIGKVIDQNQLHLVDKLLPLFATDQEAKAANIMILDKLVGKPDQYYQERLRDFKTVCYNRLKSSGCWSQQAVDALIKRAVEDKDTHWAIELNCKYDAFLDADMFKYQILNEVVHLKEHRYQDPRKLDDFNSCLLFAKRDNPDLPGALERAVFEIQNMDEFPLKQDILNKLRIFFNAR
ncbi:RING-H2 finger protein [Endozoicomonas sp. ONNA2]|uniref:RING finger protein n=1 Tax=Endozoicomonas sp. ONNA2 TaxID=2828741 RepID=UPI00214758E5|nr:RING finger protein [Endozoicomonas sp. ONNA2]